MLSLFTKWSNELGKPNVVPALTLLTILIECCFFARNSFLGFPGAFTIDVDQTIDWKPTARHWFATTQLTLDTVFPIVYTSFFCAVCFCLVAHRTRVLFLGLALVGILSDWIENVAECLLIYDFGGRPEWLDHVFRIAMGIKFAVIGVFCLTILGAVLWHIFRFVFACKLSVPCMIDQAGSHAASLIRRRFPLMGILFLMLWAPVACLVPGAQSLAANLLLLEDRWQIAGLTFVTSLSAYFLIAVLRRLKQLELAERNKECSLHPWNWALFLSTCCLAVATPVMALYYTHLHAIEIPVQVGDFGSLVEHWGVGIGLMAFGFLLATSVMWLLATFSNLWFRRLSDGYYYFPFRQLAVASTEEPDKSDATENRPPQTKGEPAPKNKQPSSRVNRFRFDFEMSLYLALLLLVYWFVLPLVDSYIASILPVSAYVVLLVWIVALVFSGLSAWFDSTRIPIALVAFAIALVIQSLYSTHSYVLPVVTRQDQSDLAVRVFDIDKMEQDIRLGSSSEATNRKYKDALQELDRTAWKAVSSRLQAIPENASGKSLVLVTCPGGGIHATAWTSLVLQKLCERYDEFAQSIGVISGVSGGSVGAMFFANYQYADAEQKETHNGETELWRAATKSSLRDLSSALALHDVPIIFQPALQGEDRGIRLETSWKSRLLAPEEQTLGKWSQRALVGEMPIVVFNSTDAASGRRVLFSSVPTPRRSSLALRLGRPLDYREILESPRYDIHVASAARASATFPYVSPFTKPEASSWRGDSLALTDGGFADNEGIITAVDWLDFISRRASAEVQSSTAQAKPFQRIIILRIQPASDLEPQDPTPPFEGVLSKVRWLTGPLEALASMRVASQVERSSIEVDLATNFVETPWWETAEEIPAAETLGVGSLAAPVLQVNLAKSQEVVKTNRAMLVQQREQAQQQINISDLVTQRAMEERFRTMKLGSRRGATATVDALRPPPKSPPRESTPKDGSAEESEENEAKSEDVELPIVTLQIHFVSPEPDEAIPLNWKLSRRQLSWYTKAWENLEAVAEQPISNSAGEAGRKNVLRQLDRYFTRTPKKNENQ